MRLIRDPQTTFVFQHTRSSGREQWQKIADILQANPEAAELVWRDLIRTRNGKEKSAAGAKGMTAEQVLRFALVKTRLDLSYRDLFDRVDDSIVLREFCRIPFGEIPVSSTLQDNIKRIAPQTLVGVNAAIIAYAVNQKVEDGGSVRIDSTSVESNIHHPADAGQLWDCVRVLTRILRRCEAEFEPLRGRFCDHTRVAKKLWFAISNTRSEEKRKPLYKKLMGIANRTVGYAHQAIAALAPSGGETFEELVLKGELSSELEHFTALAQRVISQCARRVLHGEQVPAQDKVVSIFEPHTDILVKGKREVVYGHKVFLSAGRSNLILDCAIEKGNPADSDHFIPALERHTERFSKAPREVAADAGFASKANGERAREMGVANVAFVTRANNTLAGLLENARIYKRLRNWRAGIEGIISAAKRAFGLDRCNWRGYESFQAYVHLAVLAFNLQTLARHLL